MSVNKQNLRNFLLLIFWLVVFVVGMFVAVRINNRVQVVKKIVELVTEKEQNDIVAKDDKLQIAENQSDKNESHSEKDALIWAEYRNYQVGFGFQYPKNFRLSKGEISKDGVFSLKIYPDFNSEISVRVSELSQKDFDQMSQSQMFSSKEIDGQKAIIASGYYVNHYYRTAKIFKDGKEYELVYRDDRIKIDVLNQFEEVIEGHILEEEVDEVNKNLALLDHMIGSFHFIEKQE